MGSSPVAVTYSAYNVFKLSNDLSWPLDHKVMWLYEWEPFMFSHHPANFVGQKHCGSGDILFLVAEGQDCTCSGLNLSLLFISKTHVMKAHGMPCSVLFKGAKSKNIEKNFCRSVKKHRGEGKRKKECIKWYIKLIHQTMCVSRRK